MRFKDFKTPLDEVNMGPGALQDFAKTPFAQSMTAGFEAELVVPDAGNGDDDDGDPEPDYDDDPRCSDFDDIRDFFIGEHNGRRTVELAISKIEEEMFEWMEERIKVNFDDESDEYVREALKDDGFDEAEIDSIMTSQSSRNYQDAYDKAFESYREDADERGVDHARFFRSKYPRMSDIEGNFDLSWPNWNYGSGGGGEGRSIEEVANEIEEHIGMQVKASSGYHSAKRGTGFFILEPDSSIDVDAGEGGLELVSPPMPLAQCLEYLDKAFAWAKKAGCSTNESTGFHMGISIPNQTMENVDHLKFTLFLGDEYVLKQYGRESNTYAKSMVKMMASKLRSPNAVTSAEEILHKFKQGMNSAAAKTSAKRLTSTGDRYVTVNIKDNYIEVRSAGGDYLGQLEKIKMTLLRYVRAMAIAADPEAEKQEYAKKLYKFLAPMLAGSEDMIKYFAQYSAGTLPADALKVLAKQAQEKRGAEKKAPNKFAVIDIGGERITQTTRGMKIDPFDADSLEHAKELVKPWIAIGALPPTAKVVPWPVK